jgi:hypothetical protein
MTVSEWEFAGLAIFASILMAAAAWILFDHRVTPEKRERTRRQSLSRRGRLTDGTITEAGESAIYYSYSIQGVAYTASQDITHLYQYLTADPERLVGPVSLKYSPKNPADSIVICEQWSGLRKTGEEVGQVHA